LKKHLLGSVISELHNLICNKPHNISRRVCTWATQQVYYVQCEIYMCVCVCVYITVNVFTITQLSYNSVPFVASMTPFVMKTKHPTWQVHVIMELHP